MVEMRVATMVVVKVAEKVLLTVVAKVAEKVA